MAISAFSTPQQTREYYQREASKQQMKAADWAKAGDLNKSQQASDAAAKANVAAAQITRQINEGTPVI